MKSQLIVVILVAGVHSRIMSVTMNHDSTSSIGAKIPIVGIGNNHLLSAFGSKSSTGVLNKGIAIDNVDGNSLSISHTRIPIFGNQLTGAGRMNLLNTNNNRVDANSFITRNTPNIPQVPNFKTVGGGVEYMFKNKIGASLSAANTPFLHRTDLSALGKLNLFHTPTSSLDFSAGFSRSIAPNLNSDWQPQGSLTYSKFLY